MIKQEFNANHVSVGKDGGTCLAERGDHGHNPVLFTAGSRTQRQAVTGRKSRQMPLLEMLDRAQAAESHNVRKHPAKGELAHPGSFLQQLVDHINRHIMFCPECSRAGAPVCRESRLQWQAAFAKT